MNTTPVDLICPACDIVLLSVTRIAGRMSQPDGQPGDYVMCAYCGELSELIGHRDGRVTLEQPDLDDLIEFTTLYAGTIRRMQEIRVAQLNRIREDDE